MFLFGLVNEEAIKAYGLTAAAKLKAVCQYVQMLLDGGMCYSYADGKYTLKLSRAGCQKFIVFGHHQTMLDAIEDTLRKDSVGCVKRLSVRAYGVPYDSTYCVSMVMNYSYMRIDGSVKAETRARNVTKFQTDNDVKVAILSMTAAGTGITLNAASTVSTLL